LHTISFPVLVWANSPSVEQNSPPLTVSPSLGGGGAGASVGGAGGG
jgi:hypothetical protein